MSELRRHRKHFCERRRSKRREIATQRNFYADLVVDSVTGKIFRQALAQLTGITADNVVVDCAIAAWTAKHVHPDLLFGDLALPPLKGFRNDIEKELGKARRLAELRTVDDALCQMPAWIVLQPGRVSPRFDVRDKVGADGLLQSGLFHSDGQNEAGPVSSA